MGTATAEVIPDAPVETGELVPQTIPTPLVVTPDMVIESPLPLPSIDEWRLLSHIADTLANSGTMPKGLSGRPKAVMAALLKGRELGLHPMTACTSIYIIEGLPTLSVHLMHALVKRRGHRIDYVNPHRFVPSDVDADKCAVSLCTFPADDPMHERTVQQLATVVGQRLNPDGSYDRPVYFSWTIEMAATANLLGKDNWKHHPDAMLRARATTALVRMLFPDVLIGAWYSPDELGARVDRQGNVTALPTTNEAKAAASTLGREASNDTEPPRPTETQDGISDGSLPMPGGDVIEGEVAASEPEPELDRAALWLELGTQAAAMDKTIAQWTTRWVKANKKNASDATDAELAELVKSRRDTVTQKIAQDTGAAARQAAYVAEHAQQAPPAAPAAAEPDAPVSEESGQTVRESETPAAEDLLLVASEGDPEAGVANHPFFASDEDPDVCADCLPITRGPDDPIHRP